MGDPKQVFEQGVELLCPRCRDGTIQTRIITTKLTRTLFILQIDEHRMAALKVHHYDIEEAEDSPFDDDTDGFQCRECGEIWTSSAGILEDMVATLKADNKPRRSRPGRRR